MRVICEGCHTTYDLPDGKAGQIGCPYCEHVNAAEEPAGSWNPRKQPSETFDPMRTVIAPAQADFGDETTRVRKVIAERKPSLPDRQVYSLIIQEGNGEGQEFQIEKSQISIGRERADIVLDDPEISRHHLNLFVFDDILIVRDLGSTNGTMVRGQVINECFITPGDTLQIGTTILKLAIQQKK